jgi:hypothetical protein
MPGSAWRSLARIAPPKNGIRFAPCLTEGKMMMDAYVVCRSAIDDATRSPRSLVAISRDPPPAALVHALLNQQNDYDVIVVESLARGYSKIKQLAPDLAIVLVEPDCVVAACQLLSILQLDAELSGTLVLTCTMRRGDGTVDVIATMRPGDPPCLSPAAPMQ